MKNFRQTGDSINLTAPRDLKSGDIVIVGGITGVATGDAAKDEVTVVKRLGVFRVPVALGVSLDEGDSAYYLEATETITDTDAGGSNVLVGYAVNQEACPAGFADILFA